MKTIKDVKSLFDARGKIYVKKRTFVKAVKMNDDFIVETPNGQLSGSKGDYLVEDENGNVYPVKKEIFETVYEEANVIVIK